MRKFRIGLLALALLAVQGCAAAGLTALGIGASAGVQHTLSGIAYKTFTEPVPNTRLATLKTLNRMEMEVEEDKEDEDGWEIVAKANDRTINIELERVTPATTRMRVTANKNFFFKDSATATEIIVQTAETLDAEAARQRAKAQAHLE